MLMRALLLAMVGCLAFGCAWAGDGSNDVRSSAPGPPEESPDGPDGVATAPAPSPPTDAGHTTRPGPTTAGGEVRQVLATVETDPVGHDGDAADDPAVWVHPTDPGLSLVIGTDKQGGLEVYDLDGRRRQRIPWDLGNNVDVQDDIVVSTNTELRDLHVYRVDRYTRRLVLLGNVRTEMNVHGLCLSGAPGRNTLYAFPNAASGLVQQFEVTITRDGVIGKVVRAFDAGTSVEGCAVDERTQNLYIGEEDVGIWRYGSEPEDGQARLLLDAAEEDGFLEPDVEGIAIAAELILASAQGDDSFVAYDRATRERVGKFTVGGGSATDGCSHTDGIAAYAGDLGEGFPHGVFICQDDENTRPGNQGNQNFKLVPLEDVLHVLGRASPVS